MDDPVAHDPTTWDPATRDPVRERRFTIRAVTAAATVAAGALAVGALAGCTGGTSISAGPTPTFGMFSLPPTPVGKAAVMAAFAKLRVRTTPAPSGYSPDLFGKGWGKVTGSSCSVDNFVLTRDLTNTSFKDGATCVVASGALFDPYSGQWHWYERSGLASAVGIDRVISLADAWASGAYAWNSKILHGFANDPDELLAVGTAEMAARNGVGASSWLPPDAADRCVYVAHQVKVKATYYLTVTQAEHDTMATVLEACPQTMSAAYPKSAPPPAPSAPPSIAPTLQARGPAVRRSAPTHRAQPSPSAAPAATTSAPPPSTSASLTPSMSPSPTPVPIIQPAATPVPTVQPTPGPGGQGPGGRRHHKPRPR